MSYVFNCYAQSTPIPTDLIHFHLTHSQRRTQTQNVRMHFGGWRRHEICWHRQMATEPCGSANTVHLSFGTFGHCDEPEGHGSGDDRVERRRCYVMSGEFARTVDSHTRMGQTWGANTQRESTVHVVVFHK